MRHHGAVDNNALIAALVGAALALVPPVWHFSRHVVTLVHEAGHAMVALLTGRRLNAVRLHSDTSGHTISSGRPRGPGHGRDGRGRLPRAVRARASPASGSSTPVTRRGRCGRRSLTLALMLAVRAQLVRAPGRRAGRRRRRGADLAHGIRRSRTSPRRCSPGSCSSRHPARRSTSGATADAPAPAPPTPTCWPASPTSRPACGTRSCCSRRSRRSCSRVALLRRA